MTITFASTTEVHANKIKPIKRILVKAFINRPSLISSVKIKSKWAARRYVKVGRSYNKRGVRSWEVN